MWFSATRMGLLVVAFPAGRVGAAVLCLSIWMGLGWDLVVCTPKWEVMHSGTGARNQRHLFPACLCRASGCGSLWESADLWKSFSGMCCLCGASWRSAVICWGRRGRENAVIAFCCWQGDTVNMVRMVLDSFFAGFGVVVCSELPLCSSSQKIERLVIQYLSNGIYSRMINLLLNTTLILSEPFFFLQATQSRLERRLFSLFSWLLELFCPEYEKLYVGNCY